MQSSRSCNAPPGASDHARIQLADLLGALVAGAEAEPDARLGAQAALHRRADAEDADVDGGVGVEPGGERADAVVPVGGPARAAS